MRHPLPLGSRMVRLLGRGWTGVVLVVKELGFLNVRSVEALPMAQTVPWDEDQHPLPKHNPLGNQAQYVIYLIFQLN